MKRSKSSSSVAAKKKKNQTIYQKFHEDIKNSRPVQVSPQRPVNPLFFNQKQRKVYDLVLNKLNEKKPSNPLRLLVQGTAGTGKSALINAICTVLEKHNKRFKVASFTGSSAYLVRGCTLHRCFRLPMFHHNSDPTTVDDCGAYLKNVEYFIFDEFSLIGLNLLGYISDRMAAVHSTNSPFGNKNILMFGDFSQIPPVGDRALFTTNDDGNLSGNDLKGFLAYQTFKSAVVLTESMRQTGPAQEEFRQMLMRIRRGQLTGEDIEKLNSRYIRNLTPEELQEFVRPDVTVLFADRDAVEGYNSYRLELLGTEKHELLPIDSKNAPSGCGQPLELSVGSRVFLNTNILVEGGLFNGAKGTVSEFGEPRKDGKGPECIFVRFDNYCGIPFQQRDDIPIIHHVAPATSAVHGITFQREQFPLQLAFSQTVHKAQGCELAKLIIGIPPGPSRKSMFFRLCPSVFYVALSRVKRLEDVAFSRPFRKDLVVKERPGQHLSEWLAEEARLIEMESSMKN